MTLSRLQAAILAAALALTAVGWLDFWYLTDDAFIAFRYISQRQAGHGYVWNAAPFLPVEGYTSLGWIMILDAVWTVTGLSPPQTANVILLGCAMGSVGLTALTARAVVGQAAPILFGLTLLGVVTNRTFLAWTSSGLETALFNLAVHGWLLLAVTFPLKKRPLALAIVATAIALTRPDGYLFAGATMAIVALNMPMRRAARSLAPLLLIVAHVLWRRWFYGEWLPNTYFAKKVGSFPASGARYLASFVLEYALWLPAALALAAAIRHRLVPRNWRSPRLLAGLAVVAHVGYYTFNIGGDHFEYRIYSYLVPLLVVGLVWAVTRLTDDRRLAIGLVVTSLGLSAVIPSIHLSVSRQQTTWEPRLVHNPVAPHLPAPASAYAAVFDDLQVWLHERGVGMRHQSHKLFWEHMVDYLPSRTEGSAAFDGVENPVVQTSGVGVVGWVFARAHLLDYYGLNDWVVARTPPLPEHIEHMAHARRPPPGYFEAFEPNLLITPTWRTEHVRKAPMTDERIRQLEAEWRAQVGN